MFPKEQRIHKSQDIIWVLRRGVRRSTGVIACSFLKKPATLRRVAVIVSTEVSKKAVIRNLLKRRVRSLLRQTPFPGGDLVVRLRKGAAICTFEQLDTQLHQCLRGL
ncbi:ribonuclease P protein component [Patescibacteria group bacterium]|nr:ribonuclease P protein component [Patescibacteria group bacterium]